jgi:hypothetical protein
MGNQIPNTQLILQWSQILLNVIILYSVVGPDLDPRKILGLPDPDPSVTKPKTVRKP